MEKINSLVLSTLTAALLVGCGGGSSSGTTALSTTTYGGSVIDGYISGATVCLDLDLSGACDAGEPSATTDANGLYSLTVTAEEQAHANFSVAPIIASGGIDIDTGNTFEGKLEATKSQSGTNLTPITTLVSKLVKKEKDSGTLDNKTQEEIEAIITAKKELVKKVLNITTDIDEDFVASGNSEVNKAALQIQKTVELISKASNDGTKANLDLHEKIFETIVNKISALEDETDTTKLTVSNIVDETIADSQDSTSELVTFTGKVLTTNVTDEIKKVSTNIDTAFESFGSDEDFESKVEKIIVLVESQINDLKTAIDNDEIDTFDLDEYTKEDAVFTQTTQYFQIQGLTDKLVLIGFSESQAATYAQDLYDESEEILAKNLFEVFTEEEFSTLQTKYADIKAKIDLYVSQKEEDAKEQEVLVSNDILKMEEGTYYSFDSYEDNGPTYYGYEKITLDNGDLSFVSYDSNETQMELSNDIKFDGTTWGEEGNSIKYSVNDDNSITLGSQEKFIKKIEVDLSGKNLDINGNLLTFSDGASQIIAQIEKLEDTYYLWEPAYVYTQSGQTTVATFDEYKTNSAENNNWFEQTMDGKRALAFTKNSAAEIVPKEFTLVNGSLGEVTATELKIEEISLATNVTVYKISGYDPLKYSDWYEYTIFAVYNGELYRGNVEPKGTINNIKLYNETAKDDFVAAFSTETTPVVVEANNFDALNTTWTNYKGESGDERYQVVGNAALKDTDTILVNALKAVGIDSRAEARKSFGTPKSKVVSKLRFKTANEYSVGSMMAVMKEINSDNERIYASIKFTQDKIKYYVGRYDSLGDNVIDNDEQSGTIATTKTVFVDGTEAKFKSEISVSTSNIVTFKVTKVNGTTGDIIEEFTPVTVPLDSTYDLGIDRIQYRSELKLGSVATPADYDTLETSKFRVHSLSTTDVVSTVPVDPSFTLTENMVSDKTIYIDNSEGYSYHTFASDGSYKELWDDSASNGDRGLCWGDWIIDSTKTNTIKIDSMCSDDMTQYSTTYVTFNSSPAKGSTLSYKDGNDSGTETIASISTATTSFVSGKTIDISGDNSTTSATFSNSGYYYEEGNDSEGFYSCRGWWLDLGNNKIGVTCEDTGTSEIPDGVLDSNNTEIALQFGSSTPKVGDSVTASASNGSQIVKIDSIITN